MSDIETIKQKIDIVSFLSESMILKKTGANFKGLCPFHSEKTPSFIVSPERQIWHCFGSCQDGGDIFKFLMKIENIDFPEALKLLAKRAGVTLTSSYQGNQTADLKEKIFTLNHLASEYYHYLLTTHPLGEKARDYLQNRQITDNSLNLFSIGYAPNSWDSLTNYLRKKGASESDLIAAGLVSKSSLGHLFDRFRGRLIFALKDHRGNIVGFSGRLLDPAAKEAKYINTSETPVYTKGNILYGLDVTREEIRRAGFAVIVEGQIDAIQSYQAGIRNVVAIMGSALTVSQVALLKRYTENLSLSLDTDFAGDAAAHRGIATADAAGLNIKVVTFKDVSTEPGRSAKDPDELIKKDPALWREAVKDAKNFYDFIIDDSLEKHDFADPLESKKIVAEVAPFLVPIDNLVIKNHYLKKLSQKLDLPLDSLETQLQKEFKKTQISSLHAPVSNLVSHDSLPASGSSTPISRSLLLEEYLISILIQSPHPSDYLLLTSVRLKSEDFQNSGLATIYQLLLSLTDNPHSDVALPGQDFSINDFAKLVPPELQDTLNRLYLQENNLDFNEDANILSEVQKTIWEFKELTLREKLKKISQEIKKSPDNADLEENFLQATTNLQKLMEQKALLSSTPTKSFPNSP